MGQDMVLIADFLLVAGALAAAFYCLVLSRRLSRFTDLDKGVGGAVAVLSVQVDEMTKTLNKAGKAAKVSAGSLEELTDRAEGVAKRLELLVAAMHDLPSESGAKPGLAENEATVTFEHARADEPEAPVGSVFVRHRNRPLEAAE